MITVRNRVGDWAVKVSLIVLKMSGVKDLIAKLDAAKLQEEADRLKKIQEAQEASKREATLVQERQRLEKVLFFFK